MTSLLVALLFLGLMPVLFPVISRVKILKFMTLLSGIELVFSSLGGEDRGT
jgi:hypothetical protein